LIVDIVEMQKMKEKAIVEVYLRKLRLEDFRGDLVIPVKIIRV